MNKFGRSAYIGMGKTWRGAADRILARLFIDLPEPTKKEIYDAYPFGERAYWPYKVWLQQVKWWRAGRPEKKMAYIQPHPAQERLL